MIGNFYFGMEHNWGPGVGDYLHAMSLVGSWLDVSNDNYAHVFYKQSDNIECIKYWNKVDFLLCENRNAINLFSYWDPWKVPRRRRYEDVGIDWDTKRMYYSMTDNEVFNAYDFWHKLPGGAKVVLQWQGGDQNKTHPELMHVLDYLKSLKCKICVLDHRKTGPQQYRAPALGVRFALSLCATADLFVGYDSGPFYAAIGGLVPSVGLFPNEHPDDIFTPIRVPDYSCLYMKSDLSKIKIEHIIVEIDRLWYGYGLAKIPYSLTGDHNAKNKIIRPISRHPNF